MSNYWHYRDNAPLFEVSDNVLQTGAAAKEKGPITLQAGQNYLYPFSFRFPKGTGNSRLIQYKDPNDERFVSGPHDLPATFLHTDRARKPTDEVLPNYAKIEYGIQARLVCPGVGIVQGDNLADLTITAPVLFQPTNPFMQQILSGYPVGVIRHPKAFTMQSSVLTGQSLDKIGFRQGLRDRFSSSAPSLTFEVATHIPDVLTSGSEFRFRTSFEVLSQSDNVTHIPTVQFSILKLEILDFTFIRAARDMDASSYMSGVHRNNKFVSMPAPDAPCSTKSKERDNYTERKTALNSIPEVATCDLEMLPSYEDKGKMTQGKSCEAWFTARVPSMTSPSFKSFAITRAYRVKIKLGIDVGGNWFKYDAESHVREVGSAVV